MLNWLRYFQCLRRGHQMGFVRNVYGDEINLVNARSIWRCAHCFSIAYRTELHATTGEERRDGS